MHFVDAGPSDGPVVLLMHGQPTWSYVYRRMIGILVDAGLRVVAPDNIGYGRSDKLTEPTDYTFARHVDWLHGLVAGLDLRDVTLVAQDWGGPLGLSVLARDEDRFARIVATNTILHTCDPGSLPKDVLAAYDAPFPDRSYKAGLRQLIALIPLTRNDPGAAIGRATMAVLERWQKPFVTAYSDGDPATRGWEGAGHFVQEQRGEELGRIVAEFVAHTASSAN
jgi:haloalkane dehalogenase